jgi:Rad52/22 family double-strand break repair protein
MRWRSKAAETDATKRALATFGNPFGLALYDKEQAGVTRPVLPAAFILYSPEGKEVSFATQGAFADAAFVAIRDLASIDTLYAFWERNRRTLVEIKNSG